MSTFEGAGWAPVTEGQELEIINLDGGNIVGELESSSPDALPGALVDQYRWRDTDSNGSLRGSDPDSAGSEDQTRAGLLRQALREARLPEHEAETTGKDRERWRNIFFKFFSMLDDDPS